VFYFTAVSYAVLPVDTGALVAYVHSYPGGLLFLAKVALGFPIFFHSINGIRHLVKRY
jgi:succinate dehydrogenase/fumarate reductase cytochrome b subunit